MKLNSIFVYSFITTIKECMENIIIMSVMFVVGVALNITKKTKEDDYKTINTLLIYIFLPSLILKYLHNVDFSFSLFASASMPYLLTGIATAFFIIIGRWMKFSKDTIACCFIPLDDRA